MKEIHNITVDEKRGRITLYVVERDSYGSIRNRQQMTFRKRQFERALLAADMTVPWQEVRR